ncbi:hypothetical protein ACO0K9_24555 [Undibacterium sp. Ji50W]|uniref:hypothetical protein n=1 Tax=Undibacterium sp. Ji50W TaxID=3413041 RepID=UPI003BF1EBDA
MTDLHNPISGTSTESSRSPRRLLLKTPVTEEFLHALEAELVTIFLERFAAYRDRILPPKLYAWLLSTLKYLGIFGLGLSLLSFYLGGSIVYSVRLDMILISIFSVLCVLFWDKKKIVERHTAMTARVWAWSAKKRAGNMLRKARKALPFCAEYDFRDDVVAYYRITDKASVLAWTRTIKHWRITGHYATLLFKKKTSMYPYIMILHAPSAELDSYLDELGIQSISQN